MNILLSHNASTDMYNGENKLPKDYAQSSSVLKALKEADNEEEPGVTNT